MIENDESTEDLGRGDWEEEPTQLALAIRRRSSPPSRLRSSKVGFALGAAGAIALSLVSHRPATTVEQISGADTAEQVPPEQPPHQRWEQEEITVLFDESLGALGPEIEALVEESFLTWEGTGAALPRIKFERTSGAVPALTPDGKSTVLLAPIEFEGHESDLAITIGFSNPNTGEVSEADIVINSKHVFSAVQLVEAQRSGELTSSETRPADQESCTGSLDARACDETYDLSNVLTHEVGHFFGLGENYDDTRATMFSCTSACEIHKRDLEQGDADSIVELYSGVAPRIPDGCLGVQIGRGSPGRQDGLWAGFLALVSLSWLRRRRNASNHSV